MKKIVLIILSLICIACYAETHLSFFGTQIDGTLTSFQKIIESKGFVYDQEKTKVSPLGQKVYKGKYRGRNASLRVYYNRKTEVIFKVDVYVSSFEIPVMKDYLKKSISSIEASYKFNTEHYLDEKDQFLYQYEVLENDGISVLGYIIVEGRQNYSYDAENKQGGFEVTYSYIDRKNTEKLTPISFEPKNGGLGLKVDNFYNNFMWANKYYKNGCFPDYIDRLFILLDFYKYQRGIPDVMKGKELDFESKILNTQRFRIERIPTGYSDGGRDAYLLTKENNPSEFEGIISKSGCGTFYVRLDKDCIKSQLRLYKKMLQIYHERMANLSEKEKYADEEMLSIKLPAYKGIESGSFGNIQWQYELFDVGLKYNLLLDCLDLQVHDGWRDVFIYRNDKEIKLYIEVLEFACEYFNIGMF